MLVTTEVVTETQGENLTVVLQVGNDLYLVHSSSGGLVETIQDEYEFQDATGAWHSVETDLVFPNGDYNHSGTVDAADYSVWQDTRGQAVVPFSGADGDGNGIVDDLDYSVWKANFGKTLIISSGSAEAASTSESQSVDPLTRRPRDCTLPVASGVTKPRVDDCHRNPSSRSGQCGQ